MSARTPNMAANGNITIVAGEPLSISLASSLTAGGAPIDLTGRTFALTVYKASDETEVQSVTATASGTSVSLVLAGDLSRTWRDTLPGVALRVMVAEVLAPSGGGALRLAAITDGALTINRAPRAITPNASATSNGPVIQVVFAPGSLQVLLQGSPGLKGDKGDKGDATGPALLVSTPLLSSTPNPPGIIPGTLGQFVGSGTGTTGTLEMCYSNDTKGTESFYVKSRATTPSAVGTAPAASLAGDKIHTLSVFGDGGQGFVAHIGQVIWAMDGGSKGDPTELPGLWILGTSTGDRNMGSQRTAISANSKQQVFIAGPLSSPPGPGVAYGGNLEIGVGSAGAGGAPIKLHLTGAVLLTVPEPGAFECDATGNLYFTNAAGVRKQVTLT